MEKSRFIKLHQLETFIEVARHKSVTQAARSLNLTQPAVSRTLRELEAVCGASLVVKEGRGIRITRQGEAFLRHAGTSLSALRNGLKAVSDLKLADRPAIRIGALPTVSALVMPGAVGKYLAEDLRNPLRITTGENRVLLDQLRNGELDLVMGRLPAPESMVGLSFEPLYRDVVVFAVHRLHPLAGRKSVKAAELLDHPIVMPTSVSIIGPMVRQLFIEQGLPEPRQMIESSLGLLRTGIHPPPWRDLDHLARRGSRRVGDRRIRCPALRHAVDARCRGPQLPVGPGDRSCGRDLRGPLTRRGAEPCGPAAGKPAQGKGRGKIEGAPLQVTSGPAAGQHCSSGCRAALHP